MMAKKHDETAAFLLARIKSNMNIFSRPSPNYTDDSPASASPQGRPRPP